MIKIKDFWSDYLEYLIITCNLYGYRNSYYNLFWTLHNIQFTYRIERDENRVEDGHDLREGYSIPNRFSIKDHEYFYAHWVSVLEVLIALAIRVDNEIIGDPANPHPEIFFMEMIENLELRRHKTDQNTIRQVVEDWLERRFDRCGFGSPFPVTDDDRDQRGLEMWDQMVSYLNENY